jgi:methylmalonyl-CoA/ethylmalonyl-CoA epimerase
LATGAMAESKPENEGICRSNPRREVIGPQRRKSRHPGENRNMPQIKKIDHIGIVVSDIREATERFSCLTLQGPTHSEYFEPLKVDLVFFNVGGVDVELLGPRSPGSDLWDFLQAKGEGLHHICYEVADIDGLLEMLKASGVRLIDQKPRPGSRNTRIAFLEPGSAHGVLTEYCEHPRP